MDTLRGGDVAGNAASVRVVLRDERRPKRDIALLNAAFALLAIGKTTTAREGMALANAVTESINAVAQLEKLRELTNR